MARVDSRRHADAVAEFPQGLFAQESGEIPIFLLTITHPDLIDPVYLSTDATTRLTTDPLTYGTISRSVTYLYAASTVTLPDERDKSPPACKLTIENITRALEAADATWSDVVKLDYFLRDVDQIGAVRAIRDEYVDTANPPASTLVEVSSLFSPDVLVEVQAVAIKG